MNSKECLNKILDMLNYEQVDECDKKGLLRTIKQDLDRLEQLEKQIKRWAEKYAFVEKELVQTKKNFKNSQTHSKNCYKKLKEKYIELQYDYNDLQKDYDALDFEQVELYAENTKLKKALEKACEKLDYTCPVEEELIDDLDCENCESDCKECWKKFFLKEVLCNDK